MSNFSLSKNILKVLPNAITVDGSTFSVNTDFRIILKVLRMLDDNEILQTHKINLLSKWFYVDELPVNPFMGFVDFVNPKAECGNGATRSKREAQRFCFEFDAGEIYSSFMSEYGIDLLEIPFLHWEKFLILFKNLPSDSVLNKKVELRFLDTSDFKGETRIKAEEQKQLVQIPIKGNRDEIEFTKNLEQILANGGDLTGLI